MPTLIRFVLTLAFIVALVYGAMFALVTLVEPRQGEMSVRIPSQRLNQDRQ